MINLTVNGTTYSYPQTGDTNWGSGATAWAQAVTTGMLSLAGGSFPLTAQVDFGPNFGIKCLYFLTETANPSGTGIIRLANADAIGWRNAGNTADLLLQPDADGTLQYNGVDLVTLTATQALTNKTITGTFTGTGSGLTSLNASNLSSGTVPAGRLPNPSASTLGGVQSAAAVSHQWINSISTSGVPALSQPAFSDISGSVSAAQLPNPSSSTLGGVQSAAAVSHQWINSISTSGVPALSQPAFTDISGSVPNSQLATMTANTVKANATGSTATPTDVALVSAATASAAMIRDSNANVQANNFVDNLTSTATAAGTTTLTAASSYSQIFTGTSTQTCKLPSATTLAVGTQYYIANRSTGAVSVQDGNAGALQTMAGSSQAWYTLTANGTTAGSWDISYTPNNPAGGTVTSVAMTVPTFLSVAGSPVTTNGTLAVSLSGTALPVANGGTGGTTAATARSNLFKAPTVTPLLSGSGTYTAPTNPAPLYLHVKMCGGGGGSGGTGNSSPGSGGTGGTTTFDSTNLSCPGGAGSGGGNPSGAACSGTPTVSGSWVKLLAVAGGGGSGSGVNIAGGSGGVNPLGGAGFGGNVAATGGAGISNTGGGGGGNGGNTGVNGTGGGGAGAYLEAIISSPAATYTYAVGAAGTAGAAGGGVGSNALGGSGAIIVTEYYM